MGDRAAVAGSPLRHAAAALRRATGQPRRVVPLHTGCRKVHGGGRDGLALAAEVVAERVAGSDTVARPHLVIHSGDLGRWRRACGESPPTSSGSTRAPPSGRSRSSAGGGTLGAPGTSPAAHVRATA